MLIEFNLFFSKGFCFIEPCEVIAVSEIESEGRVGCYVYTSAGELAIDGTAKEVADKVNKARNE